MGDRKNLEMGRQALVVIIIMFCRAVVEKYFLVLRA
jgi:hypothetical protein